MERLGKLDVGCASILRLIDSGTIEKSMKNAVAAGVMVTISLYASAAIAPANSDAAARPVADVGNNCDRACLERFVAAYAWFRRTGRQRF